MVEKTDPIVSDPIVDVAREFKIMKIISKTYRRPQRKGSVLKNLPAHSSGSHSSGFLPQTAVATT